MSLRGSCFFEPSELMQNNHQDKIVQIGEAISFDVFQQKQQPVMDSAYDLKRK